MKNNLFGVVLICEYIQIACIFIGIYKGKIKERERKQFWAFSVIGSVMNITAVSAGHYTGKFRVIAIAAVLLYVISSGLLIRQRRGGKETQDDCEAELETGQIRKAILIMLIWLAVAMLILLDPFEFLRGL